MGHLLRKAVVVGAVVAIVGIVPALAWSGRPTVTFVSPSPAEGATLTTNSVAFAFTYNKKPKATRTLTCTLSGPTSASGACDPPVAFGAKGSRSGKSYSGLASGSYTFTVSLTLTDGGTASATRHFTVAVPGTATAIAAGFLHSCALTSAGAVKCWGDNLTGSSGTGRRRKQRPGRRQRALERRQRDHRRRFPQLRGDERGRGQVLGLERLRAAGERDDHEQRRPGRRQRALERRDRDRRRRATTPAR